MLRSLKFRPSLQMLVLLLTVLIVTSVLTISAIYNTFSSVKALDNAIGEQTAKAVDKIAEDLRRATPEDFEVRFHRSCERVQELVPNILRVDVYAKSAQGLRLVTTSAPHSERIPEDEEIEALTSNQSDTYFIDEENGVKNILAVEPLRLLDGTPGFVTVISSRKAVAQLTAIQARIRVYSLGASIVLLVSGIVLVFRTTVYRSVAHLIRTMHRFQNGETEVRVQTELPGEFRELAVHLNQMLTEVSQFHENLQAQVQSATTALAKRNRELEDLNLLLFETQKRLLQAERLALIGQLTATFAHEIGSPLSAVSTHLQLLQENPGLDPTVSDRVRLVDREINRIIGIVDNLLSNARQPSQRKLLDVVEIVRQVSKLLGPVLQAQQTELRLEVEPGPLQVLGNADQFEQLLLNLCNNSLAALSGPGRITIRCLRLAPEVAGGPTRVQVQVSDSGAGIPADKLEHIFEPFFTTKEFGRGTGLGLAVCQAIVRQNGGRISVESPPGGGACFTVEFPECPALAGGTTNDCQEIPLS